MFKSVLAAAICIAIATPAAADFSTLGNQWSYDYEKPRKNYKKNKKTTQPAFSGWNWNPPSQQPEPLAQPKKSKKSPALLTGGPRPNIAPQAPSVVTFKANYSNGSIVIDTAGRRLYYVLAGNKAYSYPISVGKAGFSWTGTKKITAEKSWPDWHPPEEMRKRKPGLPIKMTGGINNPLGAKALYLGSSLYRIHGTNNVKSIGQAASSGCFRMMNAHVTHLAKLAGVGTTVRVLKSLPKSVVASASGGSQG